MTIHVKSNIIMCFLEATSSKFKLKFHFDAKKWKRISLDDERAGEKEEEEEEEKGSHKIDSILVSSRLASKRERKA